MTGTAALVSPDEADRAGAGAFVGGITTDPVTDETILYLLRAPAEALDDPGTPARLAADNDLRGATEIVVRTGPEQVLAWPGARRESRQVVADPGAGAALAGVPADGFTVEETTPDTQDFVKNLLALAIEDGYRDVGRDVPSRQARDLVDATYFTPGDELVSYVARAEDGELAGHVTLRPGELDELTGESFCELIDMFVLPPYRGSVCSRHLLRRVFETAAARDWRLLGHVVWNGDDAQAVYERLAASGWRWYYDLWRVPL